MVNDILVVIPTCTFKCALHLRQPDLLYFAVLKGSFCRNPRWLTVVRVCGMARAICIMFIKLELFQ